MHFDYQNRQSSFFPFTAQITKLLKDKSKCEKYLKTSKKKFTFEDIKHVLLEQISTELTLDQYTNAWKNVHGDEFHTYTPIYIVAN